MNGGRSILPAFGLVDVHSHILPGMDDGARDVAESVDLLRLSYRQDVRHMWATPHFYPQKENPNDFLRRRERAIRRLQDS